MARYVILLEWTEQGVREYAATVDRVDAARKVAADMGGSFETYWTLDEHDMVVIAEFGDDETATAFLLKLGALGDVRTKTMRAFDADEMGSIIGTASR